MKEVLGFVAAACFAAGDLAAGPAQLWDSLRLEELIEVMAEEGRDYGGGLAEDLFAQGGGPSWEERVAGLYDPVAMTAEVRPNFVAAFEGVETEALEAFFASELGQRIVGYELDARRALLDPELETAVADAFAALREETPNRAALIGDFIEVNDLIETNVASSLTFTYAFNLGLARGGLEGMSEQDALRDAWAQEDAVRQDTVRWLQAQLSLAYAPLNDDELGRYIAVSRTEAGQALNAALFQAFEPTFTRIARELGEGVATALEGQDI